MNDNHSLRDKQLGMDRPIHRRDFLNGALISAGAAMSCQWLLAAEAADLPQDGAGYYPPARSGMRGSHPGSYETAHAVRDGKLPKFNAEQTRETYDLVVVGGGISGLAAAHFYRARTSQTAKILILDNHDDFGGHAKRNEFQLRSHTLLANGGTVAIESPYPYSSEARGLLTSLGIDPVKLSAECRVRDAYKGLGTGFFFDKETFGRDCLVKGPSGNHDSESQHISWADVLPKTPLSQGAQADILRLEEGKTDYLPGLSAGRKEGSPLATSATKDFLRKIVKVDPQAVAFYQTRTHDLYGAGIDAISALDCWALEQPGFAGMQLRSKAPSARGVHTGRRTHRPAAVLFSFSRRQCVHRTHARPFPDTGCYARAHGRGQRWRAS